MLQHGQRSHHIQCTRARCRRTTKHVSIGSMVRTRERFRVFTGVNRSNTSVPVSTTHPFHAPRSARIIFAFLRAISYRSHAQRISRVLLQFHGVRIFISTHFQRASIRHPTHFIINVISTIGHQFSHLRGVRLFVKGVITITTRPRSFHHTRSSRVGVIFNDGISSTHDANFRRGSYHRSFR